MVPGNLKSLNLMFWMAIIFRPKKIRTYLNKINRNRFITPLRISYEFRPKHASFWMVSIRAITLRNWPDTDEILTISKKKNGKFYSREKIIEWINEVLTDDEKLKGAPPKIT